MDKIYQEPQASFSVAFSLQDKRRLEAAAVSLGASRAGLIRKIVTDWLNDQRPEVRT